MKFTAAAILAITLKTVQSSALLDAKFMNFIAQQGQSYNNMDEFGMRQGIFESNDAFIEEYNQRTDVSFKLGHNKFSTWTQTEKDRLRHDPTKVDENNSEPLKMGGLMDTNGSISTSDLEGLPTSHDWRELGAVNRIFD